MADPSINININAKNLTDAEIKAAVKNIDELASAAARLAADAARNSKTTQDALGDSAKAYMDTYDAVYEQILGLSEAKKEERAQEKATADAYEEAADRKKLTIIAINQAIELAKKVLGGLKKAYTELIGMTIEYADEVREITYLTGYSAEEASKLIYVSDRVSVSTKSLMTAMENAIRRGYDPTVEGLGRLSDEYVSIQDPIERSKFLMEVFGQTGADLGPLMALGAEGIRAAGIEAEELGLILSEKALKDTEAYTQAMGDLENIWAGIVIQLGTSVIPVFTEYYEAISLATEGTKDFSGWTETLSDRATDIDTLNKAFEAGIVDVKEYRKWLLILSTTPQGLMDLAKLGGEGFSFPGLGKLVDFLEDAARLTPETTEGFTSAEQSAYAYYSSLVDVEEVTIGLAEETLKMLAEINGITTLDNVFSGMISFAEKYDDILGDIAENEKRIAELTGDTTKKGITERDKLIAKNKELLQSMEDMANQVVLDMLKATIAVGGITAAEAEAYFKMADDMGLISSEASTKAVEVYGEAIATINQYEIDDKTANVIMDANDFYAQYLVIQGMLKAIENNNINLFLKYHGTGQAWDDAYENYIGPTGEAAGGEVHSAAAGAGGIAPYWVGELGPEPFFPAVDGRILSNSDAKSAMQSGRGGTSNVTVVINTPVNLADKVWVERELAPYIQKGVREAAARG